MALEKKFLKTLELDRFQRLNHITEIFAWSFVTLVAVLNLTSVVQFPNQQLFYLVLGGMAAFFLLWYHFLPAIDHNVKILIENLVFTLLVSVLVSFTGGLESYFNFFYYLVILGAVARATPRNTIIIAFGVSLAIISSSFEYVNTPLFGESLRTVAILLANQLMITLFAVYLTREIQESSKKYYEEVAEVEKIKEQDRLKDEFVFIASHELRAPITTMKGYLELILKDYGSKMNGEMIRTLKVVFEDANHLNQLVEDLLNVARIEAGRFKFEAKVFSLSDLAKKTVEDMSAKAATKKIDLTYEDAPGLKINSDEGKVLEILTNLVDNAVKYTPEFGKVKVKVEKDGNKALVSVEDNGLGIPPDFQKHIFEKFSRIERAQPGMQGTGLGLFIVKQLIDRMGGQIWFKSTEGKGSTFSFSFPLAK
jgi:signal transduction histidine kinase